VTATTNNLVRVQGKHVQHLVHAGGPATDPRLVLAAHPPTLCGNETWQPNLIEGDGTRTRLCKRCNAAAGVIDADPAAQLGNQGRTPLLTPELQTELVGWIERGAYAWVSANVVGISPSTFNTWMRKGEQADLNDLAGLDLDGNDRLYCEFVRAVRTAQARARARAEVRVSYDDPFKWLRYGPGRERPGEPGWTESHAVTGPEGETLPPNTDPAVAEAARRFLEVAAASSEDHGTEPDPDNLPVRD
jgi:hypothetical protein